MSEHNQPGADSDHVGSQPCRIRRAVALVEANFAAKLSRKEMARAAGLRGVCAIRRDLPLVCSFME